jgi:hypothetical protein
VPWSCSNIEKGEGFLSSDPSFQTIAKVLEKHRRRRLDQPRRETGATTDEEGPPLAKTRPTTTGSHRRQGGITTGKGEPSTTTRITCQVNYHQGRLTRGSTYGDESLMVMGPPARSSLHDDGERQPAGWTGEDEPPPMRHHYWQRQASINEEVPLTAAMSA